MEKSKLIEIFSAYAKTFDFDDPLIALKYNHSLNVANISFDIANSLALNSSEQMLAYFIGLVHEIGSFENWKNTKTFENPNSTMQVLFKDKFIDKFEIDKSEEKIVKMVIDPKSKQEPSNIVSVYWKILKDANILDTFGMLKRHSFPNIIATYKKTSLSKKVYNCFLKEKKVNINDIESTLDQIVYLLSLVFELNYDYSKDFAKNIDFSQGIYEYYYSMLTTNEQNKLFYVLKKFKEKQEEKK